MKQIDKRWQAKKPWGWGHKTTQEGGYWHYQARVYTAHGIVEVSAFGNGTHSPDLTILRFCMDGLMFQRTFEGKAYSERFCVTLANRFINEVVFTKAA